MGSKLEKYRLHEYPVPETMLAWQLSGAGFEHVGVDGKPVRIPVPKPGPREILCRVDAVGLCFSDVKLILAGNDHPRIKGRDLVANPTRGGHELSLTVAAVGAEETGTYSIGQRFMMQSDIYYKGRGMAFGYVFPGGMSEYTLIPTEALHGDEGSYLIPVQDVVGRAAAALVEPWACVEAAYRIGARTAPRAGGRVLVVNAAGGAAAPDGLPPDAEVVVLQTADPKQIVEAAKKDGVEAGASQDLFTNPDEQPGFDDVVFSGAGADAREAVEAALSVLRRGGHLCMLNCDELPHEVTVDVGSVHYRDIRIVGGASIDEAYTATTRRELLGGGTAHFSGAAGPMGQMHVQRALEADEPPRLTVVADIAADRLKFTVDHLTPLAKERGVELVGVNPQDFASPAEFEAAMIEKTGGAGFDDLVLCAPVGALVGPLVRQAAANCVLNIFAGVPIGTNAKLDLDLVAKRHIRIVGSSGSRWDDMKDVLDMVTAGKLNTGLSLGAVGGLAQTLEGLRGLKAGRFPGKTVIYPAVPDFPLTPPHEIGAAVPAVGAKLGPGGVWTNDAEDAFLEEKIRFPGE